jgi:hypothetical protein
MGDKAICVRHKKEVGVIVRHEAICCLEERFNHGEHGVGAQRTRKKGIRHEVEVGVIASLHIFTK